MPESFDPILPTPTLNLATPAAPARARVFRIEPCASATAPARFLHVEIDLTGSGLEGAFLPGQSFGVVMPAPPPGEKALVRLYSVASPSTGEDGRGAILAGTVRVMQYGAGAALASLAPGEEVLVTGPVGKNFLLPLDPIAHEYVFIAAGTGVAPFRGMLMDLSRRREARAALIMLAPTPQELLYDAALRTLSEGPGTIRYHPIVGADAGTTGLAAALAANTEALRSPRALLYICGPRGLEAQVAALLRAAGIGGAFFNPPVDAARPSRRCMTVAY